MADDYSRGLRHAAYQPREITDTMIKMAAQAIQDKSTWCGCAVDTARLALVAAEKARLAEIRADEATRACVI